MLLLEITTTTAAFSCVIIAGVAYLIGRLGNTDTTPSPPMDCDQYANELSSKIISASQAHEMYHSYQDRRIGLIEGFENAQEGAVAPEPVFEATKYAFYDYATIKKYFDYLACIDTELIARSGEGLNKIRFYFANYPDKDNFDEGKEILPNYKKRNSLFILPTIGDNQGEGFCYRKEPNTEIETMSIDAFRKLKSSEMTQRISNSSQNVSNISSSSTSSYSSLIFNEAGLTPPPPNDDDTSFNP